MTQCRPIRYRIRSRRSGDWYLYGFRSQVSNCIECADERPWYAGFRYADGKNRRTSSTGGRHVR